MEFAVRIPKSAAHGHRIDWPRLCKYGTRNAALYRAYLSAVAVMGRSAHRGQPITRRIAAPVRTRGGTPAWRKDGVRARDPRKLVRNPSNRFVRRLSARDLALLVGLNPGNKHHRYKAVRAFERLAADKVIELAKDNRGFRLFGPQPRAGN